MVKNNISPDRVLITSPSINAELNIGGISSLTRLLIENNADVQYIHFVRGKKDSEKKGLSWFIRQPLVLLNFLLVLIRSGKLKIVHINMPLEVNAIIRDSFLVITAYLLGKKIIVHFHGGNYSLKSKIPFLLNFFITLSIRLSEKIIALGMKEKVFLEGHFDLKSNKITVLPNSVHIPCNASDKNIDDAVRILYMGRIEKAKGLKEMLAGLELVKEKMNIKFLIAGDGPDKEYFLQECESRLKGKYEYLGVVTGTQKEKILSQSHIFILVSYYEGLPYALLEAMANGIVPIVTPVGSIPEIILDGHNGYLVPLNDYLSIKTRIEQLLKNPEQMRKMSMHAYDTAKKNYSLDTYIDKINLLYRACSRN